MYSCCTMHPQTHRSLTQAREFMRHAYGRPVSLPDVAAQANLSLPLLARLQAGLRGDTTRVSNASTHREGEVALGERKSQRYRSLLRGWLLQPRQLQRFVRVSRRAIPLRVQALRPLDDLRSFYGQGAVRTFVLFHHVVRDSGRAQYSRSREAGADGIFGPEQRDREVSRDPTPEPLYDLRDRPGRSPQVLPRHSGLRGEH